MNAKIDAIIENLKHEMGRQQRPFLLIYVDQDNFWRHETNHDKEFDLTIERLSSDVMNLKEFETYEVGGVFIEKRIAGRREL